MLDIFNNDAFGLTSMTQAIVNIKHKPSRIRSLGLFQQQSVPTTTIAIEKKGDLLVLVPPTPRGGPGVTIRKEKADVRSFIIPHFEINDAIMAEEVQNVRAFGSETAVETVAGKVSERLVIHAASHDATQEYARMGAITGVVTYADGSTLNLFTEMGVAAETEIAFDFSASSPVDGTFRKKLGQIQRQVSAILDGVSFDYIHVFCGDNFFDDVLTLKEVRDTYKGWNEAQILRESYIGKNRTENYGIFEFGGMVFENYRGKVESGSDGIEKTFIDTDKCQMFPMGVPGLFRTAYAPADYTETVNTNGLARYAKQFPMTNGKGIHFDSQMNNLEYCTRPKTLIKGKRGA